MPSRARSTILILWVSRIQGLSSKLVDENDVRSSLMIYAWRVAHQKRYDVQCYYNDSVMTAADFDHDGCYCIGDVGSTYPLGHGLWYIISHELEIFAIGGRWMPPAQEKLVIISHLEVLDAVVARAHQDMKADPKTKVFVVLRSAEAVDEKQLVEFANGELAEHKALTRGLSFWMRFYGIMWGRLPGGSSWVPLHEA